MARRPPSSRSLSMETGHLSRTISTSTVPRNVFSDEYAVDRADLSGSSSPVDVSAPRPDDGDLSLSRSRSTPNVQLSGPSEPESSQRHSFSSRGHLSTDLSAFPRRSLSTVSHAESQRTVSTASRFSITRPQSPYRGPTAPSQPYGMYAQNTRAASIASETTIRPNEQPFISQSGPEHPYSMFTQNTVPEVDDDSTTHLPLGFPALAPASFPGSSSSSSDEVGDIVGSDGHIEQLPPYTRYADNVVAKGDMGRIDPPSTSVSDDSASSAGSGPTVVAESSSQIELRPVGSNSSEEETARKEGLIDDKKKRRRTCFGLPLWTVIVMVLIVVLAAVLGGVIGGVVGNRKGTDAALASGATTTVWLDADPAQTGPGTPSCPTGHYNVPLNQTLEIDTCIIDDDHTDTWGCLDVAKLGINVFETASDPPLSVVFDDYSVRPQLFKYGPQPPDFNGTAFDLQPYKDKDDDELGIAMFFSVLFDKLIILPSDALDPADYDKRSVPAPGFQRRSWDGDEYLSIGEQPWYCFWNSTVSEFWIFLDQELYEPAPDGTSTITSDPAAANTATGVSTASTMQATDTGTAGASQTSPNTSEPTDPTDPYWTESGIEKRQATKGADYFPKLVKMVEKRKPHNNVQPYCQQMQVLNNWQIMPIPDVPTVCIEEVEYAPTASTGGSRMRIRREPDTTHKLESNCICEWFSG